MSNKRPADGEVVRFSAAFADISRGVRKIKQKDYLPDGNHPIIDQGQGLIAGYSNEDAGLCTDVPAIVFGDHTRCVKYVDEPFFAGADGVKILKPKLSNNVRYWFHALRNTPLENLGYSRHFKLLKQAFYFNRGIEAQAAIAGTLDSIERLESSCDARCSKLDELVKSRFVEMFGDPFANDFGWEERRLGDLLAIARGGSPRPIKEYLTDSPDGINWIKIGDAEPNSRYITRTAEKIKPEGEKKSRKVKSGDFLLSNSMSFGKPYILTIDGCIHDGWLVLSDYEEHFNKLFLWELLDSPALKTKFSSSVRGGVVNNLNKDLVADTVVPVPSLSLQCKFADFVTHVDKLRTETQRQKQDLQTLYDSLAQEYFAM